MLFEPPNPKPGERVLFLEDFVARFREAMRRSGVIGRDPLHPVFTMLGEMLVHFSHLQVDQVATARQVTSQFVTEVNRERARAQELVGREIRAITEALVRAVEHIETVVREAKTEHARVERDLGQDLKASLRSYVSARTWRERLITTGALVGIMLAVAGGGVWSGMLFEQRSMELTLRTLKQPIVEAATRDGSESAQFWLNLMTWNRLSKVPRTCTPQLSGSGSSYRLVCVITFWASAPVIESPPS